MNRRAKLAAVATVTLATAPVSSAGQGVEQISRREPAIGEASRLDVGPASRPSVEAVQLSGEVASTSAPAQLTTPRDRAVPPQVYRGPRTASNPDPLSRPEEGRSAALVVLGGNDRCDPEAAVKDARADCARILERRAAEFAPPERAPLSPEQRLLAEQRVTSGNALAGRRVATGVNPSLPEDQAIASVALRQEGLPSPAGPREKEGPNGADAGAAIAADVIARAAQEPR